MQPSDDPVPQPSRGPDWVHPFVQVYATRDIGLGLRAIGLVPRGATVILFGGDHMTYREVLALPADMQDIPYQVEDDVFFGVRRREDIGPGERLNHSCMPNTGFVSEIRVVALSDIVPGAPLSLDYGTCYSVDEYRLTCRCGAPACRGTITGDDWRSPTLQRRLGAYYQPYLQRKVRRT